MNVLGRFDLGKEKKVVERMKVRIFIQDHIHLHQLNESKQHWRQRKLTLEPELLIVIEGVPKSWWLTFQKILIQTVQREENATIRSNSRSPWPTEFTFTPGTR